MPGVGRSRFHQQCDVNYLEIRRAVGPSSVWSYEFHRMIHGRMSPPEAMRPCEMLPIPTDLEIVHITLLVVGSGALKQGLLLWMVCVDTVIPVVGDVGLAR